MAYPRSAADAFRSASTTALHARLCVSRSANSAGSILGALAFSRSRFSALARRYATKPGVGSVTARLSSASIGARHVLDPSPPSLVPSFPFSRMDARNPAVSLSSSSSSSLLSAAGHHRAPPATAPHASYPSPPKSAARAMDT